MMRPSAASSRDIERMIRSVYGGGPTASGVDVTTESAMRVGAVYACVLVLSQSVAQLPLHMYKSVGKESQVADSHYLYSLTHDEPNAWMTDFDFKQLVMVHLLLRGNSLWIKTGLGDGVTRELIPIHPDFVREIKQDEKLRLFYDIQRPGTTEVDSIPSERIVHFRGMSFNGFSGLNPIQYAREMIGLAIATERHGAKLFANGARLGGILQHPGKISKQAADRLIESFNSVHGGVENSHKTALIEEGMKWEKITMTAEDAQFLESRKFQRSEIAGIFRVPSHMINDLEKATFSNVEHLDLAFVKHSLTPWLVSIEKTLKKSLLTPQEKKKYYWKFKVEGLLRGDIKSRYEAFSKAVGGPWMLINEARAVEDMNMVEGGEKLLQPLNMLPEANKDESQATA